MNNLGPDAGAYYTLARRPRCLLSGNRPNLRKRRGVTRRRLLQLREDLSQDSTNWSQQAGSSHHGRNRRVLLILDSTFCFCDKRLISKSFAAADVVCFSRHLEDATWHWLLPEPENALVLARQGKSAMSSFAVQLLVALCAWLTASLFSFSSLRACRAIADVPKNDWRQCANRSGK